MDLKALIAKMDKIESRRILNEAITMKDVQAAVGQEKNEQTRARILNDLAWKENLPGLYDPVSGYYIRKQSPDTESGNVSIAATAREADTQSLAKMGLVPGTAKTSALGGLVGTGKFGLDKDSQAANDKASADVKQQSANVMGKQSSDAFVAPKLKRLTDLVAKISGGVMESFSFNGQLARILVESFSYQLYEKVTLGTGPSVTNPQTGVTAGKYQSEVAEIRSLMAELADIDDPAVIQALGAAQKALDKLAQPGSTNEPSIMKPRPDTPAGQKMDPNQADRDDADLGKAMSANAQAAKEKEYGDNADRDDADLGKAMSANAALAKPGDPTNKPAGPTGNGTKIGPANPGTKAIQHYLNTKYGQKLDVDGRDGPLTTAAIRSLSGKVSTEEYTNIAGLAYAYNVLPNQGPGTISLGNPEFVKRMTALGYDPKTGNPIGGGGQSASPAAGSKPSAGGITPGQNARDDLMARQGKAANEKVAPMPDPNRRTGTMAQRDEWMAKYGKTHNSDGTPKSSAQAASPSAGGGSAKIPADANKSQPYWVDGTRYEFKGRGGWQVTATPGDTFQWNSTRGRSMNKYTGPDDGYDKWMTAQRQQKNQQSASPTAGATQSTKSSSEFRIAGAPVVPGQPLSQVQMSVMASGMKMGNTYPPEVMAQYNKQKGASPAKESIDRSEDDAILAMIRAVR